MIKPKLYKGGNLTGKWLVTLKLDGVRVLRGEGGYVSRNGKPLYNLDHLDIQDAEVFNGSWEAAITATKNRGSGPVHPDWVYNLNPPDSRLVLAEWGDPTEEQITGLLDNVVKAGHEGLVLRQGDKWLKVKPEETYDVTVEGLQLGTGKFEGMMGALLTPLGKVGTGFSNAERALNFFNIGDIIEVSCMQLTPQGKFRHPRYIRKRIDK